MNVYLIQEFYDNGEFYEDHYSRTETVCVALTYEKAKEYIDSIDETIQLYGEELKETKYDGRFLGGNKNPVRYYTIEAEYHDVYPIISYHIKKMEVIE